MKIWIESCPWSHITKHKRRMQVLAKKMLCTVWQQITYRTINQPERKKNQNRITSMIWFKHKHLYLKIHVIVFKWETQPHIASPLMKCHQMVLFQPTKKMLFWLTKLSGLADLVMFWPISRQEKCEIYSSFSVEVQ